MTLDEAITHERKKATEIYTEAMLCHANPDDGKLDACIECAREHEQLADWLEELKKLRENNGFAMLVEVNKLIKDIKFGIKASNTKHDNYMTGIRNGLRWCLSMIDGKEPEFEKCNQWIPCSERLPKNKKEVLTQWIHYYSHETHMDILSLNQNGEWYGQLGCPNGKIIAWMPLPEPYKEGD